MLQRLEVFCERALGVPVVCPTSMRWPSGSRREQRISLAVAKMEKAQVASIKPPTRAHLPPHVRVHVAFRRALGDSRT